jgi:hypothetical protein
MTGGMGVSVNELASLSGEPGGVVLSSGIVDRAEDFEDSDKSDAGGDGDVWRGRISARGVVEGDRDGGNGTFEASGDEETTALPGSPSDASDPKLSERNDRVSSSSKTSSLSSSPSASPSEKELSVSPPSSELATSTNDEV